MLDHGFAPVYDENSRILILGSFPSVASREIAFYYGHPRNRFWPLFSALLEEEIPSDPAGKIQMLLRRRIALYDALESAQVEGSMDANIKSYTPADLSPILNTARICRIYCNGKKSYEVVTKDLGLEAVLMPSTSPANAAWSLEKLVTAWSVLLDDLMDR